MLGSRIQVDLQPAAPNHVLVGPAPQRYALWIFPPSAGTYTLSNEPIPAGGNGIVLGTNSHPLRLCVVDDGQCVQLPWYIAYAGGAPPAAYIDVLA